MKYGHWIYPHVINVEEWCGFNYRIINTVTKQEYLGKKQFFSIRRVKVKGRKNRKIVKKETKWQEYTGSSTHLNEDIVKYGKSKFIFKIESLHKTKASLSYTEVHKQVTENVLREKLDDGERKYYNRQIGSVKYLPPDETEEEEKHRVN